MLNGTPFISTMCLFFGQALINHVLEVFITRIDGIKQDLSLYKATADFKHTKRSCSGQLWVWKSFWGSPLLWFEEAVMARQNRNTDPVKPHMGRQHWQSSPNSVHTVPLPYRKCLHGFMLQYVWVDDCDVFVVFCSFSWKKTFSLTTRSTGSWHRALTSSHSHAFCLCAF